MNTEYRCIYVIDVSASSPREAAEQAYAAMVDPESLPPVLGVIQLDSDGHLEGHGEDIDLASKV